MLWLKEWANSDSHPKIVAAGFWGATVFRCLCRVSAEFDLNGRIPPVYHRSYYLAHRLQLIFEEPITCGRSGAPGATPATDAVAWIASGTEDAIKAGLLREDGEDLLIDGWGERQVSASQAMSNTERSRAFRARHSAEPRNPQRPATARNGATTEESREEKRREEEADTSDIDPTGVLEDDGSAPAGACACVASDVPGQGELVGMPSPVSAEDMQRVWNEKAPPKCSRWARVTNPRRRACNLRLDEHRGEPGGPLAWWERVVEKVAASRFLSGEKTDWCADIDWLLKPGNLVKVEEGKYDDRAGDVRHGAVRAEDMKHGDKVGVVDAEEWTG